jgi:hypothetical protein
MINGWKVRPQFLKQKFLSTMKKNNELLLHVEELEQRIAPDAGGINDPHDGPPGSGN